MKKLLTLLFVLVVIVATSQNSFDRWVPTSGTNTYTTNITSFPGSYNNTKLYIRIGNGNSGASTIAVNGLPPIPIRIWDGDSWEPVISGELPAGSSVIMDYDNNNGYYKTIVYENLGSGGGGGGSEVLVTNGITNIADSIGLGGVVRDTTKIQLEYIGAANSFIIKPEDNGINNPVEFIVEHYDDGLDYPPTIKIKGGDASTYGEFEVQDVVATMRAVQSAQEIFFKISPNVTEPIAYFSDGRSSKRGIEYAANGYVTQNQSLTDKQYVDAKVVDAITNGETTTAPSRNAVFDADALKYDLYLTANRQTASYQPVLSDAGKLIEMNVAGANNFTIPDNATVAYPIGTTFTIAQYGAGLTTVVAGGSNVIRSSSGVLTSPGQYSVMVPVKIATNEWYLWNGNALSSGTLSKVDDTNVTMTLGGTPANSLFQNVSMTLGWTGQLGISRGGTGADNTTITYTPTLTNSANISASTARQCTYFRVGNTVTVSGQLDIDPTTTATLTTLGISLPIASNFTTAFQAGGTGAGTVILESAGIFSDATNDRVTLQYTCVDVTNHTIAFSFTYQVL